MKYTLRPCDGFTPDLKVESGSVPRAGETIALHNTAFSVIEVRHVVEPDDGSNRGVALTDIVVFYE